MNLDQIRYFVAAYEEGSISKAAEREHCTQPGVSAQIKSLEAMVSHTLFKRHARGVTPTVAGRHFYASCTEVLKAVKGARQRMFDLAGSVAGKINLGVPPTFFKRALPSMLPIYLSAHPYVDVRLAEAYSGTLTDWVVAGEIDAAIVTEPPAHLGLETAHFFRDRLVLVSGRSGTTEVTPQRSLGSHKHGPDHLTGADLAKLKLILPSAKHSLRRVVENAVRLGVTASGKILEVDGLLGTLELVRNSDWATVLPAAAVMDEVSTGRLTAEPISNPELWLDYFLIQTREVSASVACRDFFQCLKKTLEDISKTCDDWQNRQTLTELRHEMSQSIIASTRDRRHSRST